MFGSHELVGDSPISRQNALSNSSINTCMVIGNSHDHVSNISKITVDKNNEIQISVEALVGEPNSSDLLDKSKDEQGEDTQSDCTNHDDINFHYICAYCALTFSDECIMRQHMEASHADADCLYLAQVDEKTQEKFIYNDYNQIFTPRRVLRFGDIVSELAELRETVGKCLKPKNQYDQAEHAEGDNQMKTDEHYRGYGNIESYHCGLCEFWSGLSTSTEAHLETIHKVFKYSCRVCGNSSRHRRSVQKHVHRKHPQWKQSRVCGDKSCLYMHVPEDITETPISQKTQCPKCSHRLYETHLGFFITNNHLQAVRKRFVYKHWESVTQPGCADLYAQSQQSSTGKIVTLVPAGNPSSLTAQSSLKTNIKEARDSIKVESTKSVNDIVQDSWEQMDRPDHHSHENYNKKESFSKSHKANALRLSVDNKKSSRQENRPVNPARQITCRFTCALCDYRSGLLTETEQHLAKVHNLQKHCCSFCSEGYLKAGFTLNHIRSKHPQWVNLFACSDIKCSYITQNIDTLKTHCFKRSHSFVSNDRVNGYHTGVSDFMFDAHNGKIITVVEFQDSKDDTLSTPDETLGSVSNLDTEKTVKLETEPEWGENVLSDHNYARAFNMFPSPNIQCRDTELPTCNLGNEDLIRDTVEDYVQSVILPTSQEIETGVGMCTTTSVYSGNNEQNVSTEILTSLPTVHIKQEPPPEICAGHFT